MAVSPPEQLEGSGSTISIPSQATDLLHALKNLHAHGTLPANYHGNVFSPDLVRFNIGACTLTQLSDHIKKSDDDLDFHAWFENRLHCEYTSSSSGGNIFTIKLKTRVHQAVVSYFAQQIERSIPISELREEQEDESIIETIENIAPIGTPSLDLVALYEGDICEPDAAWATSTEGKYPNLVLEVACSESLAHLRSKARHWVCGTDGSVRWVLGIKVDPPPSPLRAEAWLWQAMEKKGGWSIREVRSQLIIPADPGQPFFTLELQHFLARDSNVPPRIQGWLLTIPLLPLVKKIEGAIKRQAMDAEEKAQKKAFKG
ncbi:MAG: hypothetical protein Q9208_007920 [Pyrenodesmia sp. 3 TL-2023]